MIRPFLVVLGLALSYSSYSEEVFDSTSNAAVNGHDWVMKNILPQQPGLKVNGVLYRYTTVKETEDAMTVSVQNNDATQPGYIFRETDDWTGVPANTIQKYVPTAGIVIDRWGDGSIDVTGKGSVVDASVIYNYQYDKCFDPLSDPSCPGYQSAWFDYVNQYGVFDLDIDINNTQVDEYINDSLDTTIEPDDLNEEETEVADNEEKEVDMEEMLSIADKAVLSSLSISKSVSISVMNNISGMVVYYKTTIPGGVYKEPLQYKDKELPTNKRARRVGLAQQLKHNEMIELQYSK